MLLRSLGEGPPAGSVTRVPGVLWLPPSSPQGRPQPPPTMEDSAGS